MTVIEGLCRCPPGRPQSRLTLTVALPSEVDALEKAARVANHCLGHGFAADDLGKGVGREPDTW